ncbi:hypothetical protein [Leptolyngbya iicbica]|uniref:Uncharacterized protein n=1 Tax=Lyngbya confervoides BDU141951 TaxID=1574623 RepID=A0A8T6QM66_9CYAN|nr:hypothetical protein [Leptolyngbya sp. LK]
MAIPKVWCLAKLSHCLSDRQSVKVRYRSYLSALQGRKMSVVITLVV